MTAPTVPTDWASLARHGALNRGAAKVAAGILAACEADLPPIDVVLRGMVLAAHELAGEDPMARDDAPAGPLDAAANGLTAAGAYVAAGDRWTAANTAWVSLMLLALEMHRVGELGR